MKQSFLLWILLYPFISSAQNLLPNPGFEKNVHGLVADWRQPYPDRYHYESYSSPDNNGALESNSINGLCLHSHSESEYLLVQLKEKLKAGQQYHLNLDIIFSDPVLLLSTSLASVDIKFFEYVPPAVDRITKIYGEPDIKFPFVPGEHVEGINTMECIYTARGNEQFLVIGKFFTEGQTDLYQATLNNLRQAERLRDSTLKIISDTFFRHYPSINFEARGRKARRAEEDVYMKIIHLDSLKREAIENTEKTFRHSTDSMQALIKNRNDNYWHRIYFDNVCLSHINSQGNYDCRDPDPVAMAGRFIKGNTYRLSHVNFDLGQYALKDSARMELNALAAMLLKLPLVKIKLTGHTDNIAGELFNLELSSLRAKACRDYLVSKGVSSDRIMIEGAGAKFPMVSNDSDENRAVNRRVEFVIR